MSRANYSTRAARFLINRTEIPGEKEAVLAYALQVISLNGASIILTLLLGFLLKVLPGTLICLITLSAVRLFAGGAHSNSPVRCTVVTSLLFPLMALAASKLSVLGPYFTGISLIIIMLAAFLITAILAPVDSPSAPIISNARRKKMKILSLAALGLLSIILAAIHFKMPRSAEIEMCFGLAVLWSQFILTTPGHKLFLIIDRIKCPGKGGVPDEKT